MSPDGAASLRRSAAHVVVDDVDVPVLADADAHHVFRVLRVSDGQLVSVTDCGGRWRVCRAVGGALEPDGAVVDEPRPTAPVTIGFAIPKQDRPEWIVQKLTELGVDRIVLLHADRSVVRWDTAKADKHVGKLNRVAVEAVQQCRRVWVPEVVGPVPAVAFLPTALAAEPGAPPDGGGAEPIAIGPEGDWSARELAAAAGQVSLGPTVLRVETAALVAAVRRYGHGA